VRLFSVGGATPSLDQPALRRVVGAANDLDIPVVLLLAAGQLPPLRALVAAFPSARFVLDHCGFADLGGGDRFPNASDLFALADLPNLYLKVSSMTLRATAHPQALWSVLAARFGSGRLMWGSDFPHTHEPGYAALVEAARTSTCGLEPGTRADVLSGTALRLWPELSG
jgi:predicted TIM-barrel fold metal-dependent hydrolase